MKEKRETEITPIQGTARLAALIFHYCAQEAVEALGPEKGRKLVSAAIRKMGLDRGRRIREVVDEAGLEPTLENMFKHYDLPMDAGWAAETEKTGATSVKTFCCCPMAEVWQELGAEKLDALYCDVDMAIIEGYNPDIEIRRIQSILKGDGHCVYEYTETDG